MAENKCGDCFWFTKTASVYNIGSNIYDHYCKLHYMEELRHKDTIACCDFKERDKDDKG